MSNPLADALAPVETEVKMQQLNPETGELVETDLTTTEIKVEQEFDFDALEEAEVGASYKPVYWSPEAAGEVSRGYFMGFTTIQKREPEGIQQIKVAAWANKQGVFINGGKSFVEMFTNIKQGAPIMLTYKGTEKTKAGFKVKVYDLNMLNLKR